MLLDATESREIIEFKRNKNYGKNAFLVPLVRRRREPLKLPTIESLETFHCRKLCDGPRNNKIHRSSEDSLFPFRNLSVFPVIRVHSFVYVPSG